MRFSPRIALALPVLAAAPAVSARAASDPALAAVADKVSLERIQRGIYVLASFRTRHTLSDPQPSGDGIGGALAWIETQFSKIARDSGGRMKVEEPTYAQAARPPLIPRPVDLTDVVATLAGSGPAGAPVYVLEAHYDSRGDDPLDPAAPAPGADGNGSGTAALIEVARAMSGGRFQGTLVFIAAAGGDQYGAGAEHWAREAKKAGVPVAGVIQLDGIGNSHGAGGVVDRGAVRLFAEGAPPAAAEQAALARLIAAGGENDTPARELARAVGSEAAGYGPGVKVRIVYRSDRRPDGAAPRPFLSQGFASVRLCEAQDGTEPPASDTPQFVDFAYVGAVARTAAYVLGALADAPAPPSAVSVEAAPGGGASLRWAPSAGAVRYRIVWRDTTAPDWEHGRDAPGATASIPAASPENALFGVEAIGAGGRASPAAYALPDAGP